MMAQDAQTTTVPMLDLRFQNQHLLNQMRAAFDQAVTSGQFILGPAVESFERNLAQYCRVRHAIGMSSGTDALLASLIALDVGPGDEVITSPFTFFATAGCVARLGAKPVFVDIDPETFNLDPAKISSALTPRTRAIIPVHLFGLMADMGPIHDLALKHELHVIEDAAQAIGAADQDQPPGSCGHVACLSFYPTKNLSALGDAGACLTNDDALAHRLRQLRAHGQETRYKHTLIGGNFRLDALQAAMLDLKLPHLDTWQSQRIAAARCYLDQLQDLPLTLPLEPPSKHHAYHQFTIRVPDGRRDELRTHLQNHKIQTEVYYPIPLHLQPCFADLGYHPGHLPQADSAAREVLSLPIFPGITPDQQRRVTDATRDFFK